MRQPRPGGAGTRVLPDRASGPLYSISHLRPIEQVMRVNDSLVFSALLAADPEEIDSLVGLIETYRQATRATKRFSGRNYKRAVDTARLCEAMLIEHLLENSAASASVM